MDARLGEGGVRAEERQETVRRSAPRARALGPGSDPGLGQHRTAINSPLDLSCPTPPIGPRGSYYPRLAPRATIIFPAARSPPLDKRAHTHPPPARREGTGPRAANHFDASVSFRGTAATVGLAGWLGKIGNFCWRLFIARSGSGVDSVFGSLRGCFSEWVDRRCVVLLMLVTFVGYSCW